MILRKLTIFEREELRPEFRQDEESKTRGRSDLVITADHCDRFYSAQKILKELRTYYNDPNIIFHTGLSIYEGINYAGVKLARKIWNNRMALYAHIMADLNGSLLSEDSFHRYRIKTDRYYKDRGKLKPSP